MRADRVLTLFAKKLHEDDAVGGDAEGVAMAYRYTCHAHTSTSWLPLNKPRCGMPCPRQYASHEKEKATTKQKSAKYDICSFLSW